MKEEADIKVLTSNDLTYDQRMIKVCNSLFQAGYSVELIGRSLPRSEPLLSRDFQQRRLNCFVHRGPIFYLLLNIRLFFYLMIHRWKVVYAVDLDTLPAATLAKSIKGGRMIFDAHEYFTEVPELEKRSWVKGVWERIGRWGIPRAEAAITVGPKLARILADKYDRSFGVVRNCPAASEQPTRPDQSIEPPLILLYQGVLNKGRGLEQMINAMQELEETELWLLGEGDVSEDLHRQVERLQLGHRVRFPGLIPPEELPEWTARADIGLNLLDPRSKNYYYSLANKLFDYTRAGLPSINMNFPEYRAINEQYEIGLLIDTLEPDPLIRAIRSLRNSPEHYRQLRRNCLAAAGEYTWEGEEERLLEILEGII